ncbi:MAG TPA: 16S rRNA (cytosine(1402)-N(4))-methyltransferase RsmH [Dehalococcoidia bacterium]|nr:16S rRNA (cytosine(1402)-N(4))-methyltransferase RsmH [Dehalococcoidia bacterium]
MLIPTHIPVLVNEILEALAVQPGGRYIDCTLGAGGHAAAILERSSPGGQLLGIDADPEAIKIARARLEAYSGSSLLINENFANLQTICIKYDFFPVHGILLDLGLSSLQLNGSGRGFSFQHDAPLDMRLSPNQEVTAADIINTVSEAELAHLIREYGEEGHSWQIAHHIVNQRPIKTTLQLAQTIEQATGGRRGRLHPATKTFQALRIAVNHELEHLEAALKQTIDLLGFEGRLVVISYHSLEDRIVKQFMRQESRNCICPPGTPTCVCRHTASLRLINKKVTSPSLTEIQLNPRSRSAKLRAAERIANQDELHITVEELGGSTEIKDNGWRRPALLKKLRRTFLSAQFG